MNNQDFWNALNLLNIYSIILAEQNLIENREQSAANDVHAANDEQAKFLLDELSKRFDRLQKTMDDILEILKTEK